MSNWITACHISRLRTDCWTGFVERLTGGQRFVVGSLLLPSELCGWHPGERMVETCQWLKSSLQCELLLSCDHKGVQSGEAMQTDWLSCDGSFKSVYYECVRLNNLVHIYLKNIDASQWKTAQPAWRLLLKCKLTSIVFIQVFLCKLFNNFPKSRANYHHSWALVAGVFFNRVANATKATTAFM